MAFPISFEKQLTESSQFTNRVRALSSRFRDPSRGAGLGALPQTRFGTFIYPTRNVGDEIQTIAQLGFLPEAADVVAIDRERLNEYNGDRVLLLANGWFLHNPENWPPSDMIDPLFFSIHLAPHWTPSEDALAYFRKHEPIGCRDTSTLERLRSWGVQAYFSGCLTLTLNNPFGSRARRRRAVICDAHLGWDGGYPPSAKTLLNRLVPQSIQRAALFLEQECSVQMQTNHLAKHKMAVKALSAFAQARLVITTRLHCALPCLALGTPVVFLHEHYDTDPRFDGLRSLLKGYGPDAKEVEMDWANPAPTDIAEFRQNVVIAATSALRSKLASVG